MLDDNEENLSTFGAAKLRTLPRAKLAQIFLTQMLIQSYRIIDSAQADCHVPFVQIDAKVMTSVMTFDDSCNLRSCLYFI